MVKLVSSYIISLEIAESMHDIVNYILDIGLDFANLLIPKLYADISPSEISSRFPCHSEHP